MGKQGDKRQSRWGVGPVFAVLSSCYFSIIILVSRLLRWSISITTHPLILYVISGCFLIVGIPFFIASLQALNKAYAAEKLVTSGIYSFCRNPIYASWILFLVPAIVISTNNWIAVTVPFFMDLVLRLLIKKEENFLESAYGMDYQNYKKEVLFILPLSPCFQKKGRH